MKYSERKNSQQLPPFTGFKENVCDKLNSGNVFQIKGVNQIDFRTHYLIIIQLTIFKLKVFKTAA